ncbi:putative Phage integrase family protein [uncultured Sporomusa sp.]|uniref:Putative Phage integrase family protein n=1 Tax=uncultured Sporomusa sp. TaxID=307249 RepID=A0A212LZT6_9FIRM|nr:tyrosine-type recombinase/integrase [uncultured Sporomusa sp.]SCM83026.1 putative Phage integrase family protein [uncultured Sporomusa sp.]
MSNQTLTEQFAQYLKEDGKRLPTIQSYAGDVNGFLTYLQQMGTDFDGNLKRFHITSYRNRLVEDGYEASTVNKKINSLQAFNRWLIDRGMTVDAVVDLRKDRVKTAAGSEKQVEVFSEKQLERLLFCIQGGANTRDRAIVLTLLYTGIRVSELCEIKLRYLDFLINHLKIVGKGGKVREVPLKPEVTEGIKAYLPDRADSKYAQSENLFLGQRGPLQRDAVNTLLERLADKAGLDVRLKPHTFRHTFCTRLVKKGVPLPVISKLAGHSSIETTARFYLSTSKEDKIQAVSVL